MSEVALTNAEYIAFGSFIISCISAAMSSKSLLNSSRALRLSEGDHHEKARSVAVYLAQALKVQIKDKGVFASFGLSYRNSASVSNTISSLVLAVHFVDDEGQVRVTLVAPHDQLVLPKRTAIDHPLALPINVAARSTVNGWISFKLSPLILTKQVKKYEIKGITSDSAEVVVSSYLLMDAFYGENHRQDRKSH